MTYSSELTTQCLEF